MGRAGAEGLPSSEASKGGRAGSRRCCCRDSHCRSGRDAVGCFLLGEVCVCCDAWLRVYSEASTEGGACSLIGVGWVSLPGSRDSILLIKSSISRLHGRARVTRGRSEGVAHGRRAPMEKGRVAGWRSDRDAHSEDESKDAHSRGQIAKDGQSRWNARFGPDDFT